MLRSPLHDLHLELGAKLGTFAGFEMPLWYPTKTINEHLHTRTHASLFDISHMGQISVTGCDAASELEALIPTDLHALPVNRLRYCYFTNNEGGILDDLIVTCLGQNYLLVVNAARKEHDLEHLRNNIVKSTVLEHDGRALIGLQGPKAHQVLGRIEPQVCELRFMTTGNFDLHGVSCTVSRCGYTGEDGFEISMPAESATSLAKDLLAQPEVIPAGLGARDSLRLEAGLRLYGQDIDTTTTPVEAHLQWTISKSRRSGGERAGGYPGDKIIQDQLTNGVNRRFVGLLPQSKMPARTGTDICGDNNTIGQVTSGLFAPSLKTPIAVGYVEKDYTTPGTEVHLNVRGNLQRTQVVALPFVPHRYNNI